MSAPFTSTRQAALAILSITAMAWWGSARVPAERKESRHVEPRRVAA